MFFTLLSSTSYHICFQEIGNEAIKQNHYILSAIYIVIIVISASWN